MEKLKPKNKQIRRKRKEKRLMKTNHDKNAKIAKTKIPKTETKKSERKALP